MDKEKIVQVYEAMADITLAALEWFGSNSENPKRKSVVILDNDLLEMVRTTQSLYETINYANYPIITATSCDASDNLKDGCKYTDCPDFKLKSSCS